MRGGKRAEAVGRCSCCLPSAHWQVTLGNLVVNFISLPGYFVGLLLIDRLGRKKIQLSEATQRWSGGTHHAAAAACLCT